MDSVRFFAAFIVFVSHASSHQFTGNLPFFWRFMPYGADAVMVFFVLSGFVIAFVASGKEKNIDKYFVSRFARLYSVVLPALLLTVTLDLIGSQLSYDQLYTDWGYQASEPVARFFANLLFVNQLWFLDIRPFSNVPFWSIGYEFWYYVIFAVWFYMRGRSKYVLLLLVSFLVGPKIILLLPIWFLGVLVYKVTSSNRVSETYGWMLFMSSVILYSLYLLSGGHQYVFEQSKLLLGPDILSQLGWSKKFASNYIVGMLVAVNFIGFSAISHRFFFLDYFAKPIRYLASYTFALYLLHYPLLTFFSALTFDPETNRTEPTIVVAGTVFFVWFLGGITEKKKGSYKVLFEKIWLFVKNGRTKNVP
jgi:peptidoglycan/LPS O-acetylase OafA/YrhL